MMDEGHSHGSNAGYGALPEHPNAEVTVCGLEGAC